MRVLIIHCFYKYKGGEDTVVAEEFKLLKSNNVDVALLEFNNYKNTLSKILQLPFNFSSYYKTRRKLKEYNPEIVHIHNMHFGASASVIYAVKKSKLPIVVTLHNFRLLCPSGLLFHNGKPFLQSLQQRFPWSAIRTGVYQNSKLLTFWLAVSTRIHHAIGTFNLSDRFIVLSTHSKKIFRNSFYPIPAEKVVIKPNFCYEPTLVKHARGNDFLYVGRLSEEKGISLLLQAFSTTGNTIKIAGDGPLKNTVKDFASKFPNIQYVGIVSKEAVYELLNKCAALVFPSIWFEGMPLTIIEAFANGTPVIASKIGAMDSMVDDKFNGLHFEPDNLNDLIQKLNEFRNLTIEVRETYNANALRTYYEHYTPEENLKQLLAIYNSVLPQFEQKEILPVAV